MNYSCFFSCLKICNFIDFSFIFCIFSVIFVISFFSFREAGRFPGTNSNRHKGDLKIWWWIAECRIPEGIPIPGAASWKCSGRRTAGAPAVIWTSTPAAQCRRFWPCSPVQRWNSSDQAGSRQNHDCLKLSGKPHGSGFETVAGRIFPAAFLLFPGSGTKKGWPLFLWKNSCSYFAEGIVYFDVYFLYDVRVPDDRYTQNDETGGTQKCFICLDSWQ